MSTLSSEGVNPRYHAVGEDGSRPLETSTGISTMRGFRVRMFPSDSLRLRLWAGGKISPNNGLLFAVAVAVLGGDIGDESFGGTEEMLFRVLDSGKPLLVTLFSCERVRERDNGLGLGARDDPMEPGGLGITSSWVEPNLLRSDLKLFDT